MIIPILLGLGAVFALTKMKTGQSSDSSAPSTPASPPAPARPSYEVIQLAATEYKLRSQLEASLLRTLKKLPPTSADLTVAQAAQIASHFGLIKLSKAIATKKTNLALSDLPLDEAWPGTNKSAKILLTYRYQGIPLS